MANNDEAPRAEGVVKFELTEVSSLNMTGKMSATHIIGGLPWSLTAMTCFDANSVIYLGVLAKCKFEGRQSEMECDADVEFRVIGRARDDATPPPFAAKTIHKTYSKDAVNWGVVRFLKWSDFTDVDNGYVTNDTAQIEARVVIKKIHDNNDVPMHKLNVLGCYHFRFDVTTFTGLAEWSPSRFFNIPWVISASFGELDPISRAPYLALGLKCNHESLSNLWSCHAEFEFKLVIETPHGEVNPSIKNGTHVFTKRHNQAMVPRFIKWNELLAMTNGLVTIDFMLKVTKAEGLYVPRGYDFTKPSNFADTTLSIGDNHLYVNKMLLSSFSPFFENLFNQPNEENHYRLTDIDSNEFIELLHVIYPSHYPVHEYNAEFLLKVSEKFKIDFVKYECEKFLVSTVKVNKNDKIRIADRYKLATLQDAWLKSCDDVVELNAFRLTNEFEKLGNDTKFAILHRTIDLYAINNERACPSTSSADSAN
ncbi:unnamed protein product [Caenorhabditis bovis]|uniref:BTB domain-containing protein n=1 Tax=Caenorhabditis bovis TaxID=2654633 RepID=A0A8S1EM15_9PELO|nr:unnamed protein product [Caenorhabditis bovis]